MAGIETVAASLRLPITIARAGFFAGSAAVDTMTRVFEPTASRFFFQPPVEGPDGLIAHEPINEAQVGRQLVVIGRKLGRGMPERPMLLAAGHLKIARAVIDAEVEEVTPLHVTQEVVALAHEIGTNPILLAPVHLPELDAYRAASIMQRRDSGR